MLYAHSYIVKLDRVRLAPYTSWFWECRTWMKTILIDFECQICLIIAYVCIWLIPFISNISVPAKASELYLDLRRLVEEQVQVCAWFSYVTLVLHVLFSFFLSPFLLLTANSSYSITGFFGTIRRKASSWFASRRATCFYSCSRSTRDPNSLRLDGEASNLFIFLFLFKKWKLFKKPLRWVSTIFKFIW